MDSNNQDSQNAPIENGDGRRKFLQRSAAGFALAALSSKSVWATNIGITASIVASGHGSDFAGGFPIQLQKPGYWRGIINSLPEKEEKFNYVFGGKLIVSAGYADKNRKLKVVLNDSNFAGPNNINVMLVAMYLNATYSGFHSVYYPVADGHPFSNPKSYAKHVYNEALQNPLNTAAFLDDFLNSCHQGGTCTVLG